MPSEWKSDKEKAVALDNSRPFDVHRWSDFPEVNDAVDHIYEIFSGLDDFKGNKGIRKRHIKVVVLDLYVAHLVDPTMYIGCHRGRNKYSQGRYNELHISFVSVAVVDALESLGFVEVHKGYQSSDGRSRVSRTRALPKLIDLIQNDFKITVEMVSYRDDRECIILREKDDDDKKVNISYEDTEARLTNEVQFLYDRELQWVQHTLTSI
jgi:hypothetical protein